MNGERKATTAMLAVVLGVLLAATGVFGTLFLLERSAAAEVREQVTVREKELAGARDRLDTEQSTVDKLADEERDLVDANDALRACADPAEAALAAARAGEKQALSDAVGDMLLHCER